MDFLKKHYDKLALAGALLVLIVSALWLSTRVSSVSTETESIPRRTFKGDAVKPIDLGVYSNALDSLKAPPLWTKVPFDPFKTVITAVQTRNTNDIPVIIPDTGPPVQLIGIAREPFKLLFKAYSGAGENFQLNFQFRDRTFFVLAVGGKVADRYEDTGYVITNFEQKSTNVVTNVGPRAIDISELTLKHEGEDPITLTLGKEAIQREPVASVRCTDNLQTARARRGQRFDCGGKTYIVVDIKENQMIIVDAQSEEKHTISLSAARE